MSRTWKVWPDEPPGTRAARKAKLAARRRSRRGRLTGEIRRKAAAR